MEELVDHLEKSVQTLLEEHIALKQENNVLQKHFRELMREKNELLAKNNHAAGRIEQILEQLRSLVKQGDRPVAPTAANTDEQLDPITVANTKQLVIPLSDTLLIDEPIDLPDAEDSL